MGFKTVMSDVVRLSNDSVPRRWGGSGACEKPTEKIDERGGEETISYDAYKRLL